MIGQRVGRLSERCRSLLVPASVLGREFGLDALARLSDLSRDELLESLDEAMTERVVGDVPGSPGRLRFAHALIRDTLYDEPDPGASGCSSINRPARPSRWPTPATWNLISPSSRTTSSSRLPAGSADRAIDYARRAGDRAASQLAYEEAARLYEMALQLVGEDLARCELLLALGEAQARAGDTPASKEAFRRPPTSPRSWGWPSTWRTQRSATAAGSSGRSRGTTTTCAAPRAGTGGARATRTARLRVRLLARLAGGPLRDRHFPPESEEVAERGGTRRWPAASATRRRWPTRSPATCTPDHSPESTHDQVDLATELIQVAMEAGDLERALEGHETLVASLELGDARSAKEALEAMAKLARGAPTAIARVARGRLSSAARAPRGQARGSGGADRVARGVGERAQGWHAARDVPTSSSTCSAASRAGSRRSRGSFDAPSRSTDTYPAWRCVLADMLTELGHEAEARSALEALAADEFAAVPFDEWWLVSMSRPRGGRERSRRHEPSAATLYELLAPYCDRVARHLLRERHRLGCALPRPLGGDAWGAGRLPSDTSPRRW